MSALKKHIPIILPCLGITQILGEINPRMALGHCPIEETHLAKFDQSCRRAWNIFEDNETSQSWMINQDSRHNHLRSHAYWTYFHLQPNRNNKWNTYRCCSTALPHANYWIQTLMIWCRKFWLRLFAFPWKSPRIQYLPASVFLLSSLPLMSHEISLPRQPSPLNPSLHTSESLSHFDANKLDRRKHVAGDARVEKSASTSLIQKAVT